MINLKSLICEAKVPKISLQQALDANLFGPVYHGSTQEKLSKIGDKGFVGLPHQGDVSHGYDFEDYHGGIPAPIHHLGFGIYFTTKRSIAKQYSFGTTKGLKAYFLKIPKLETINFAATNTMMKWWRKNGYDFQPPYDPANKNAFFGKDDLNKAGIERFRATVHMTDALKSQWDAVWFKGKGMFGRVLDGDQVCVYEPEGKVFEVDLALSKGLDAGAKVRAAKDIQFTDWQGNAYGSIVPAGTIGIIKSKQEIDPERIAMWKGSPGMRMQSINKYALIVKWKKGGEKQVADGDVEPLSQ